MIILITPTGGRQKQFDLCCQWMRSQTYKGKVLWIVVDDCVPVTTDVIEGFSDNWVILRKRPVISWKQGDNTQGRNLKIGIDLVKAFPQDQIEGIFIIEDDDYYTTVYLEKMMEKLKGCNLAGEIFTIYYHTRIKKWQGCENRTHSSLFQIAFTPVAIPYFEKCYDEKYMDIKFCKIVPNINLFSQENLAIGMKGMVGRQGIGVGHRETGYKNDDKDLGKLKSLLGEDYKYYL